MRNAAQLAVEESGANDVTLMVLDDRSTPEGAAQAAQQAISGGAELIVGPLFSPSVREVRQGGKSRRVARHRLLDRRGRRLARRLSSISS